MNSYIDIKIEGRPYIINTNIEHLWLKIVVHEGTLKNLLGISCDTASHNWNEK
jgi:hypothetical protein